MQFIPGLNSVLDTNASGWATYKELIPAVYGNYIFENKKWEAELGLRIIGYNTQNLSSAIKAFKLHYIQTEVDDTLDEKTINTIYSIFKKQ